MIYPQPKPLKTEKKKRKKVVRGLSEGNLLKLHREAVRKLFFYRCFFCHFAIGEKEVHHVVKRKNFLLRYSWRNGILVCKYICHPHAETPEGKHKIDLYIEPYREYLQERSGSCKDWFVKHGITRNDYLREMYNELKEIAGLNGFDEIKEFLKRHRG